MIRAGDWSLIMISTLIRHSDLSSRQSSHSCLSLVSSVCVSCVSFVMFAESCERNLSVTNASMHEFCLWFVTGFSSQSFPPALFFCIRVACEKERQLVFLAFVSEFLFFLSVFFFCKGRRRRRRRRNKTKKRKDDEEEETRRTREWF